MANLVYKRVSTDQQLTDRQSLVLAEAGIEDPVVFEEQAGASSRLHSLERPKFGELLAYRDWATRCTSPRCSASIERCQMLDGAGAIPAQRKARREYENRVNVLVTDARR